MESTTWMHSAASFTLFSVMFDPIFLIVDFKRQFKCSRYRSMGLLRPAVLVVLTQRDHFTCAACHEDRV